MFRPFCPTLETLEKREVFSAGAVAAIPLAIPAGVYVEEISSGFVSHTRPHNDGFLPRAASVGTYAFNIGPNTTDVVSGHGAARGVLLAGTYGRGVVGDWNGDGRDDVAAVSGNSTWTGPVASVDYTHPDLHRGMVDDLLGWDFHLPYMEQDNLYKFADNQAVDVVFDRDLAAAVDEIFGEHESEGGNGLVIMPDPGFKHDGESPTGAYCSSDFWHGLRTRHDTVKNSIGN